MTFGIDWMLIVALAVLWSMLEGWLLLPLL